ncbi:hypothetical protein RJ55_04270 [Drechmeria coniospora]|nr:hypothetical protein RJ55_04270 [Drechmeria coniospora]
MKDRLAGMAAYASGLEIFGAVIAGLDATILIVSKVHDAIRDAKELPERLRGYRKELEMAKTIVRSSCEEPTIRTKKEVVEAVQEIGVVAFALDKCLRQLDQGRGRVKQMAHQLIKGGKEVGEIEKSMGYLGRRKDDLVVLIGLLNTSLSQKVKEQLDRLESRYASGLASAALAKPHRETCRTVTDNTATGASFMFNGPVVTGPSDRDPYADIDKVSIHGNRTEGSATMLNYAVHIDVLERLADNFLKKVRGEVEDEGRNGQNGQNGRV